MHNKSFKTVGLLANLKKPNAIREIRRLCEWLITHGCTVAVTEELDHFLSAPHTTYPASKFSRVCQLVIVLGGDGTLLWGARTGLYGNCPVLGVNFGTMGFLVSTSVQELYPTLENVLKGIYSTDKRMMLEAKVFRKDSKKESNAHPHPARLYISGNGLNITEIGELSLVQGLWRCVKIHGMKVGMYRFLVIIEKAKGNYSGYSPDLPGCVATGKTCEETEINIHEAIEMHVQGMIKDKIPVPKSVSVAKYIAIKV